MIPWAGVRGILGGVPAPAPWRTRCSVARQQSRSGCKSGADGIDPEDCGERIERCPQVRKSVRTHVHG